jgi:predicted AlkP superfamily pyrophosphatase or phosphodiesterase
VTPASSADRVVVLDVVGLQPEHLPLTPSLADLLDDGTTAELVPPFPAVTVPAQTTLATGRSPGAHGDVANGVYDRDTDTVELWGRDVGDRRRVWETGRDAGLRTGVLFFQHLFGTTADVAVTPKPIEDEDNNLIEMNCWTNPDDFYDLLREEYAHFPLHNYWGPGAGAESSRWILSAARESIERYDPDMLWTYVPHLDYAGQRDGPSTPAFEEALGEVDELVGEFLAFLRDTDRWDETVVAVVSEYGFHAVDTPVFPNRALRDAGLLEAVDHPDGGTIPDLGASSAFAVVDHQIAHVYLDGAAADGVSEVLEELPGVDRVLTGDDLAAHDVDHPNAGDFVLVADPDAWFAYYWWEPEEVESMAPPYAQSVDIHDKPGYDPCELFLGESGLVSMDPSKVSGSHGRVDPETHPLFGLGGPAAADLSIPEAVDARRVAPTVLDLLGAVDDVEQSFEEESLLAATRERS